MKDLSFSAEPAMYLGFVNAALLVLVTFGIPISNEQKAALDALLGPLLAVLTAFGIRSLVTPNANVPAPVTPSPVAPPAP